MTQKPPMTHNSQLSLDKLLKHYRLSNSEYREMKKNLNHEPNLIEWAVYSALWSEHCSYKSSKVYLRKLFSKHPRVVQGPGENAGVIDLGLGERVAFKMESHNHPSFIEPTQGAATGVGGILRDIFTMGARPMASMDYLCFGDIKNSNTPRLLEGVVRGIGGYGNCVGVPTVNGQTTFNKSYNGNILVNAFSLGLFRPGEDIFYGKATGVGNLIVYVGARTGRDGIHGAAMASESFDEDIERKKPNVQIGDPFFEKLLIEACLEVMKHKLVVGIQDMGAAGLTSSTFEMASRAQSGLKMDLKKVPLREPDITAEEILLSESQERMVLVVEPSKLQEVKKIFSHWDLSCSVIGEITQGIEVELYWGDKLLAKINHQPLVENAPVYERPFELPLPPKACAINMAEPVSLAKAVVDFLSHPQITSRDFITSQYDQRVGAQTMVACEDSVALLKLPDSGRILGMTTGCRPLLMEWHPEVGAKDAIVLPVLKLSARGVKALAVTDCLNFGNPEKSRIMGEFVSSLRGLNEACVAFDVPIISGNVSLYNETSGESIIGTPSTGVVGLREVLSGPRGQFSEVGLDLYLVGTKSESTWMGEYAQTLETVAKPTGYAEINLLELKSLQSLFLDLSKFACASQVISKGGLVSALFKMCASSFGVSIDYFENERSVMEFLFAERFYSAVWAVKLQDAKRFILACESSSGVKFVRIGATTKNEFRVNHYLKIQTESLNKAYETGLGGLVETMA